MSKKIECPYCGSEEISKIAIVNDKDRYRCNNKDCLEKTESGKNRTFYLGEKNIVSCPNPECNSMNVVKIGHINGKQRYACIDCQGNTDEYGNREKWTFYGPTDEELKQKQKEESPEPKKVNLLDILLSQTVEESEREEKIANEEREERRLKQPQKQQEDMLRQQKPVEQPKLMPKKEVKRQTKQLKKEESKLRCPNCGSTDLGNLGGNERGCRNCSTFFDVET